MISMTVKVREGSPHFHRIRACARVYGGMETPFTGVHISPPMQMALARYAPCTCRYQTDKLTSDDKRAGDCSHYQMPRRLAYAARRTEPRAGARSVRLR